MITAENLLMTLLGIGPGLLVGYELARLFMAQFTNDQFDFDLEICASTFVLSALAILVVALFTAPRPARRPPSRRGRGGA